MRSGITPIEHANCKIGGWKKERWKKPYIIDFYSPVFYEKLEFPPFCFPPSSLWGNLAMALILENNIKKARPLPKQ